MKWPVIVGAGVLLLLMTSGGATVSPWILPIPAAAWCAVVEDRRRRNLSVPGSRFGPRVVNGKPGMHAGQDIPCPPGTPLLAVADGVVVEVREGTSAGTLIRYRVDAPEPGRVSCMHLTPGSVRVVVGATIRQGEHIADTGFSGNVFPAGAAGAHLHIEWKPDRVGSAVDPLPLMPNPEDCA